MESHESPAGYRRRRRHAGHQIMVAAAVVRVLVVKRTQDGEFVRHRRELRNAFAEMHAGQRCGDVLELTADFRRRVRLGIKGFVVGRAAIQPDEDAVHVAARPHRPLDCDTRLVRRRLQPEQIAEPQPQYAPQAELEKIPAADAGAVGLERTHENFND